MGNEVVIVDMNGKIVAKHNTKHQIHALQLDRKFCFLGMASKEGVKVMDPRTLNVIRYFKSEFPMRAISFSPCIYHPKEHQQMHMIMGGGIDAKFTTVTTQGGYQVNLMDLKHEEEMGKVEGHYGPINYCQYHNDGKGFVTAGEEGIVRIYRYQNEENVDDIVAKSKKAL